MQNSMTRWGRLAACALLALMGCNDADGDTDDGDIDGGIVSDGGTDVDASFDVDATLEPDAGEDPPVILGTWADSFGGDHTITSTEWRQTYAGSSDVSIFVILTLDRDSMVLIAKNSAENPFNPSKFSRFDWTVFDDRLFYCQSAFDAETAEAAAGTEAANPADPENGGCGGMFPWTELLMP